MSDNPAQTLILDDSPPAHRIEHPAQTGLWISAGLLALLDVFLLGVLIGGR